MKSKKEFRQIYMDGSVLAAKIDVHSRYSSNSIGLSAVIAARCGAPSSLAMLDIGCGTGHLIEHLSRIGHGGRLVGLDLAHSPISDTVLKRYVVGDAENLPFADSSFDIITCVHTLSHIGDIPAAMNEARRVLRSRGMYLATANSLHAYPHTSEYRRRIHNEFDWGEPIFTTTRVNVENLEQALTPHWHVLTVERLDGELRIPTDEYAAYFAANIPTWDRVPTAREKVEIFRNVDEWARLDQQNGYIIEAKRVGLAICVDDR